MAKLTRRGAIVLGLASFVKPWDFDAFAEESTAAVSPFFFPGWQIYKALSALQTAWISTQLGPGAGGVAASVLDPARVKNITVDIIQCGPTFLLLAPAAGEVQLALAPELVWKLAPCTANLISDALPKSVMNSVHDDVAPLLTPWGLLGAGVGGAVWGKDGYSFGAALGNLSFDLSSLEMKAIRSGEALPDIYSDSDSSLSQGSALDRNRISGSQAEIGPGLGDFPESRTSNASRSQTDEDDPTQ